VEATASQGNMGCKVKSSASPGYLTLEYCGGQPGPLEGPGEQT